MKAIKIKHPLRNTIFYGFICGLTFVPVSLMFNAFIPWSQAACLTLWFFSTGYALLLSRWGTKNRLSVVFPLLFLLAAIFLIDAMVSYFILALIVISWIRSGICYQETGARGLAVELVLCTSGAVLVQIFTPGSVFAWALGVWLFFLIQTLFFAVFAPAENQQDDSSRLDAFELASRQAERILSDPYSH